MSTSPVALILGAGPRVGAGITASLSALGYTIATASRSGSGTKDAQGVLALKADFTQPSTIPTLFSQVKEQTNTFPSVVVYNAAALTPPTVEGDLFSVPGDAFVSDLNVNVVSAYIAGQEAVKGWAELPKETIKTFIYTGNILNQQIFPVPIFLNLGVGKSASAHWVGQADALYAEKGYRFIYADQREPDGKPCLNSLSGPAHGEFFAQLAKREVDVPWLATFVEGKGYVKF